MIPEGSTLLLRVPNWIGDVVMCSAGIRALRENRPDLKIIGVMKPWVMDVLRNNPHLDEQWIYSPGRGIRRIGSFFQMVTRIRKYRPISCVLFQTSFESALIPFLAGIPQRIGMATDHRKRLLTHIVPPIDICEHQVRRYLSIAEAVTGKAFLDYRPEVFLSSQDRSAASRFLGALPSGGPIIPIAPGAAYGSAKCWPPSKFAEFTQRVVDEWNARVIFLGSTGELETIHRIEAEHRCPIFIAAGQESLLTQAAIIESAHICIANDSGLMHLAAALGVRVIALFGPTNPSATGPYGDGHIVLHHPVPCAPCRHRICPVDHSCMNGISTMDLFMATKKIMRENFELIC